MLQCSICKTEKRPEEFHSNSSAKSGRDSRCIPCKKVKRDLERQTEEYRAWDYLRHTQWIEDNPEKYSILKSSRRIAEQNQIASWTRSNKQELRAIAELYKHAKMLKEGFGFPFHVDHIVPLKSKFVCGFTCLNNMEVLTDLANCSKGNHWWPDMQEGLNLQQIQRDSELALAKKNPLIARQGI